MAHNSRFGVALIFGILACAGGCSRQKAQPTLTPEGKAYVKNLQLSDVSMQESDSLANQTLTEILGNIKNTGDRTVTRVDVTCIFFDPNGKPMYQERVAMVKSTLRPNEMRNFRLAFDAVPEGWNKRLPQLVIALVVFG